MLFEKKKFSNVTAKHSRDRYPTREELSRLIKLYGMPTKGGCIMEPHDSGGYRCHVVHPDDLRALQNLQERGSK